MAGNNLNDRNDQHELSPDGSFPQQGQSQYPQPQHSFSYPSTEYPPLSEHDLGIAAQAYSQPIQQNLASQLQDAAHNGNSRNGDGSMRINTNGGAMSGMVAPHGQSFSVPGGRDSVDNTPDSATPGDKSRMKAKASQACDECRRKKTKCITNVSEDGVPTPCNSCVKAGLDCQYSRQPLKRGPNKGYIKDLADRVQQVESLMTQPGYRQSFDGDIFATGEEPMSARRNFSLPGGRTSFSGPDFGRARFDSLTSAYTPLSAGPRQRDRFSIAIPPDQPVNQVNFYDEIDQRPAKRVKMSVEIHEELPSITIEPNDFNNYYHDIHANFPLLLDSAENVVKIVQNASNDLQHALIAALKLLPITNGAGNNANSKSAIKTKEDMEDRLAAFYNEKLSSATQVCDALVYIWITSLLIIHAEYAVDSYTFGALQPYNLVRQAAEIATRLVAPKTITEERAQGFDSAILQDAAGRAYCLSMLHSKLVLLATGNTHPTDSYHYPSFEEVDAVNNISQSTRFLCYAIKTLSRVGYIIKTDERDLLLASLHKDTVFELLQYIGSITAQLDTTSSQIYQQLEEFVKLICSRITPFPTSLDCLMPAAKLAEKLGQASATYAPLDMHLYTACVMTFLEVLALPNTPNNEFAGPVAISGISKIRPVLQEKANAYISMTRSANDKLYWGTKDGVAIVKKSWAEALLQQIDLAEQNNWVNPNTLKFQSSFPVGEISGNFGELVGKGYLTVLSWHAAEHCEAEQEALGAGGAGVGASEDAGAAMASAAETAAAATAVAAESLQAGGN